MTDHLNNTNRLEDEDLDQVAGGTTVTDEKWIALIPKECDLCGNEDLKTFHRLISSTKTAIEIQCGQCGNPMKIHWH